MTLGICVMLSGLWMAEASATQAPAGPCQTDLDCSLNGHCNHDGTGCLTDSPMCRLN
jgi:hypothetical protein